MSERKKLMPCLGTDCEERFWTTPERRLCKRCSDNAQRHQKYSEREMMGEAVGSFGCTQAPNLGGAE